MPIGILGFPAILRRTVRMPFTVVLSCMGVHGGLAPLRTILTGQLVLIRPCIIIPTMGIGLGILRDRISKLALFVVISFLRRCTRRSSSIELDLSG